MITLSYFTTLRPLCEAMFRQLVFISFIKVNYNLEKQNKHVVFGVNT